MAAEPWYRKMTCQYRVVRPRGAGESYRVVSAVSLDDVVLDERVTGPAVDAQVLASMSGGGLIYIFPASFCAFYLRRFHCFGASSWPSKK